jgi:hypothetical protein
MILVNRSGIHKKDFYEDISLIYRKPEEIFDFNSISIDPFKGRPTPFYYRILQPKGILKCIFGDEFPLNWWVIDLPIYKEKLIVIAQRPAFWDLRECLKLEKKYQFRNPKAIQINKKQLIWGPALFFKYNKKDLSRDEFINEYVKKSVLKIIKIPKDIGYGDNNTVPKNEKERYVTAQKFIKLLINRNVVTFETGYILFGSQLMSEYVFGGHPFYQAGRSFHTLKENANLFLQLTKGSKENKRHVKGVAPGYACDILSEGLVLPEKYKEYDAEFKKLLKNNNLLHEFSYKTYDEIIKERNERKRRFKKKKRRKKKKS